MRRLRRVRPAGAGGGITRGARSMQCGVRKGSRARGAAALEWLGHGAQSRAMTLVDAGAEDGDRERAGRAHRHAGGAVRARAAVAMADRGRVHTMVRARPFRRVGGRGQRRGGHLVRAQVGLGVVRPRVPAVVHAGHVGDVARRVGRSGRGFHSGHPLSRRGARARGDERGEQRAGEEERGGHQSRARAHVTKHRRLAGAMYQERANSCGIPCELPRRTGVRANP